MFMKGPGIVWLWNLVSESKHDVKWGDVDLSFGSGVSFSTPALQGECLWRRPCITKTGQFFKDYSSAVVAVGFYFWAGNGGKHAGGCCRARSTHRNAQARHFECQSRRKARFLPRHLILQQTQQKQKRLIYLNLAGNTSASAVVPVRWGKIKCPGATSNI